MPFRSTAQRRFMWSQHPDIARRWTNEFGSKIRKKGGKMKALKIPAQGKTMKKKFKNSDPATDRHMQRDRVSMMKKKNWTQAQDDTWDRKHGVKEGSKADIREDRAHGIKDKKKKKNWIQGAIKHPGALRRTAGVKAGHSIPSGKLNQLAHRGGVTGRRARLAETLKGLNKKTSKSTK